MKILYAACYSLYFVLLFAYLQEHKEDEVFESWFLTQLEQFKPSLTEEEEDLRSRLACFAETVTTKPSQPVVRRVYFLKTTWVRYAAAVIILIGLAAYFWLNTQHRRDELATTQPLPAEQDLAPGHDGAILTLGDGSTVVLDSARNGIIAHQNGARVILKDKQLAYSPSGKLAGKAIFNTMTTPKGRQFRVTLPDGTQVWLNAASSIRYPTVFTGSERVVDVTGEAYFEVVKNEKIPFRVNVSGRAEIKVLGTSFNINAYENEIAVKTTLLEGSVRVSDHRQLQILRPGQQAQIMKNEKIAVIDGVDVEEVIAWKNGYFNFNGNDLQAIMREIARWYDLEVVYESEPKPGEIAGKIQRNLSLNQLMATLQDLEINYRLEGRKLIITK